VKKRAGPTECTRKSCNIASVTWTQVILLPGRTLTYQFIFIKNQCQPIGTTFENLRCNYSRFSPWRRQRSRQPFICKKNCVQVWAENQPRKDASRNHSLCHMHVFAGSHFGWSETSLSWCDATVNFLATATRTLRQPHQKTMHKWRNRGSTIRCS